MAANESSKKMDEINGQISREKKDLVYNSECEDRTIRMYPPDGGGHGHKWREKINANLRYISKLEAELTSLKRESENIYKDERFKETCRLIIPDFRQINLELVEYFSNNPHRLQNLEWRKFEELLESIFRNQEYKTELGPGCGDGGVDLRLIQKDSVGQILTLVQAKKYKKENPIHLDAVQALYGAVEDQRANRGPFVTTSRYLPSAEKFAAKQEHKLILANSKDVARWCKEACKK